MPSPRHRWQACIPGCDAAPAAACRRPAGLCSAPSAVALRGENAQFLSCSCRAARRLQAPGVQKSPMPRATRPLCGPPLTAHIERRIACVRPALPRKPLPFSRAFSMPHAFQLSALLVARCEARAAVRLRAAASPVPPPVGHWTPPHSSWAPVLTHPPPQKHRIFFPILFARFDRGAILSRREPQPPTFYKKTLTATPGFSQQARHSQEPAA